MWDKIIDIIESIKVFFRKVLPTKHDDQETKYFKITLFLIIGLFGTMLIFAGLVFFLNLKGDDKTVIPDVSSNAHNKIDLISAILTLQEKKLNFTILMKTSSKFGRGIVMEQKPNPGTAVKMGRTVALTVSKGSIITKIEDYTGNTLAWLKYELQGAFASNEKALVEIREPIMYRYDESEPGTILEQSPKPGSSIYEDKITYLDLIVSKGPKGKEIIAEDYTGKRFEEVISKLASNDVQMNFQLASEKNKFGEGIIVEQNPEHGKEIQYNSTILLTVNPVKKGLGDDDVFGIFDYIIERQKVPVDLKFIVLYKNEQRVLLSMKTEGGKISIPYILKKGSDIEVYIFDEVKEKIAIEGNN